jgi:hypothetical protein
MKKPPQGKAKEMFCAPFVSLQDRVKIVTLNYSISMAQIMPTIGNLQQYFA